ncbi:MAG: hypothetical protein U5K76_12165 [Woeseiaceae bacterium]|nr:hypothetical protein [Woeseiaceae bacterium]
MASAATPIEQAQRLAPARDIGRSRGPLVPRFLRVTLGDAGQELQAQLGALDGIIDPGNACLDRAYLVVQALDLRIVGVALLFTLEAHLANGHVAGRGFDPHPARAEIVDEPGQPHGGRAGRQVHGGGPGDHRTGRVDRHRIDARSDIDRVRGRRGDHAG